MVCSDALAGEGTLTSDDDAGQVVASPFQQRGQLNIEVT